MIMIGKNIKDWPFMYFSNCQIQDFLSQSIEVTVGSYIQAHQFVTHSQSSFLRQDQFLPINGAGKD